MINIITPFLSFFWFQVMKIMIEIFSASKDVNGNLIVKEVNWKLLKFYRIVSIRYHNFYTILLFFIANPPLLILLSFSSVLFFYPLFFKCSFPFILFCRTTLLFNYEDTFFYREVFIYYHHHYYYYYYHYYYYCCYHY